MGLNKTSGLPLQLTVTSNLQPSQVAMETRFGNLLFTSKFDSGNLARVEKVTKDDEDGDSGRRTGSLRCCASQNMADCFPSMDDILLYM